MKYLKYFESKKKNIFNEYLELSNTHEKEYQVIYNDVVKWWKEHEIELYGSDDVDYEIDAIDKIEGDFYGDGDATITISVDGYGNDFVKCKKEEYRFGGERSLNCKYFDSMVEAIGKDKLSKFEKDERALEKYQEKLEGYLGRWLGIYFNISEECVAFVDDWLMLVQWYNKEDIDYYTKSNTFTISYAEDKFTFSSAGGYKKITRTQFDEFLIFLDDPDFYINTKKYNL